MRTWIHTLAYAAGTVILTAGVFSLAQWLLARIYGERLDVGDEAGTEGRASAARSGR